MILQWKYRSAIEDLQLQWRGSNLYEGDWVERNIGTLTGMHQVEEKITVIRGPTGQAATPRLASMQFVMEGKGAPITAGESVDLPDVPFDCRIISWTVTSDKVGSVEVTICRSPFDTYPDFEEISGTEKPFLDSQQKNQDNQITTWETNIHTGDILRARIDSAVNIDRLYIGLRVQEN